MSAEILAILPNLSIGVVSVVALVYVCIKFLEHLKSQSEGHAVAMNERETAMRVVEREVRTTIMGQLAKNTEILNDTSKTMERVMLKLDK